MAGIAIDNTNGYLYYLLTDGSATTTLDELRRTPLSAASETTLTNNLVDSPGTLAVDLANNRILVANVRNNLPRIAAISLTAPYTVTTFLTPGPINGAATSTLAGIALGVPPPVVATVTTNPAANVTTTSALLGGNITVDGGATVTDRGVVYSTSSTTPTTGNTKVQIGAGKGSFSQTISSLIAGTTYYVRAYAINSAGTAYGAALSFATAAALATTGSQTNVSCFGGSNGIATVNVTGGVSPYSYAWSPSGGTGATATGLAAGIYTVTVNDASSATITRSFTITQPATVVGGSTVVTNVSCFGGSNGAINLTPSGGTGPYTFNWGGGPTTEDRTGLTAGTYTVTITDANGCTGTVSATVTQPATVVGGSTVVTNVSCFGGSNGAINLTPSGGTGPYTFNWGGGPTTEDRTSLTAGTYTVTITDANGCTGTVSATVTQPATAISLASGSQTNVTTTGGSNGTASVTPTGGTPGYTYDWAPGTPPGDGTASVSGLSAGTYTVTVTDANGCTATRSFTITQPTAPTITGFAAEPASVCVGSPLTFTAMVGNLTGSDTYTLTNGSDVRTGSLASSAFRETLISSGTGAQSFTLTVSSSGQRAMATTPVTVNALPVATLTNEGPLSCTMTSVILTASGGGTYQFSPGASQLNGGNTASVNTAGTYSVTVTSANGCTATASTTVDENKTPPTASLASSGTITCTNTSVTLTANTGAGLTYRFGSGATQIGTSNQATVGVSGTYSVTVTGANGCSATAQTTVTGDQSAPTASLTNNGPLSCTMTSVTLTASGGGTYRFSSGATQIGTSNQATVSSSGTYSVTVTATNGCSATAQTTVTGDQSVPTASLTNNGPITCSMSSVTLTATGGTSYRFSSGASQIGSTNQATVTTSGLYSVTVTNAGNGCSGVASTSVSASTTRPTATISGNTTVTSGGSTTLTASGGTSQTWSTGETTASITVMAGTYSVTVTNASGCSSTTSVTVSTVNSAPVATANANQTATVGVPFSYTVNAFSDSETPNQLTYSASISPANGFSFDPNSRVISGTPSMSGVSQVSVTTTDPGSLSASTSFTITVSPAGTPPPTATFSITGVTTMSCQVLSAGQRRVSFTPRYAGLDGSPVSFSVVNEMAPTTSPGPYSLNLYTDNSVITLQARQSGAPTSFAYNWLSACSSSTGNTPPTVASPVPPQSATVGVGYTLSLANVFTDAETPNGLSLSVTGLPVGLNFVAPSTISGTPSMSGVSSVTVTATDPGSLSASTSFTITVNPAGGTPPPPTGTFSITSVQTIRCEVLSVGQRRLTFNPQYAGLNGAPVSFQVVNELAPTTAPGPYTLNLYTDNSVVTLRAQQSGIVSSFAYNWLSVCSASTANTPPTVANPVPPQSATVGVGYTLSLAGVFTDAETPNQLTLSVSGLPAGLNFVAPSTISGTPSMSGVSTVTVTATDPGNMSASTSFTLTVNPAGVTPPTATFSITGVQTISCQVLSAGQRRLTFNPQYAGLDGAPVSFSVVNELVPTTNPGPYTLDLYTDNPVIGVRALQSGVSASFSYGWLAACNPGARLGTGSEVPLRVTVLGNPVVSQTVDVEVRGAQGQSLRLQLTDERGHLVSEQSVGKAGEVEQQTLRLGQVSAGVLLLRVSTSTQSQTLKLLKAE